MASSNKNIKIEHDEETGKPKSLFAEFIKTQGNVNQTQLPPPIPVVTTAHHQIDTDRNVLDEIKYVQQLMRDHGEQGDFGIQIKFGDLIRICGHDQVDKLVEILAIARKNGYVNYNLKDFLQQDRDEDLFIRLVKTRQ